MLTHECYGDMGNSENSPLTYLVKRALTKMGLVWELTRTWDEEQHKILEDNGWFILGASSRRVYKKNGLVVKVGAREQASGEVRASVHLAGTSHSVKIFGHTWRVKVPNLLEYGGFWVLQEYCPSDGMPAMDYSAKSDYVYALEQVEALAGIKDRHGENFIVNRKKMTIYCIDLGRNIWHDATVWFTL